jgi:FMN phosphatase YigB (HAD superfamily)
VCAAEDSQDGDFVSWLIAEDEAGYRPREAFYNAVLTRLGRVQDIDLFARSYHEALVAQISPSPEVLTILGEAREAGWRVGIITNGDAFQQMKIDAAGLSPVVDGVCISELEGMRKPVPELFALAAKRCGSSLEGAWMIGDNPSTDIGGATAAGISSVWMHLGREWPELGYTPDYTAASFPEAVRLVLNHA